ncbi:hypothetical protein B5S30_g4556 [[Candida] boidinii]|nr:hypothetical protein B5S30_g4556 [[Candida] boidinii]
MVFRAVRLRVSYTSFKAAKQFNPAVKFQNGLSTFSRQQFRCNSSNKNEKDLENSDVEKKPIEYKTQKKFDFLKVHEEELNRQNLSKSDFDLGNSNSSELEEYRKKQEEQEQEQDPQSQFQQQPSMSSKEQKKLQEDYELVQRAKAIIGGGIVLLGLLAAVEIYSNWDYINRKVLGVKYEIGSIDEVYENIKERKERKKDQIDKKNYNITNSNDSNFQGVYICGNNENGICDPEHKDKSTKSQPIFKRLDIFDGLFVKDLYLGPKSACLIDSKGDLYQWGDGFNGDSKTPTLKNKKLTHAEISNGVIYALTEKGEILYLPENHDDQLKATKKVKKFWGLKTETQNFEKLVFPDGFKNLRVKDFSTGDEHLVLLTNDKSVFTCATGNDSTGELSKSNGQFGLPNFSQFDTPPKPNELYEVGLLNKFRENNEIFKRDIVKVAAGDFFTLCLDNLGYVWAFGKNTYGALGRDINYNTEIIPYPMKIDLINHRFNKNEFPQCIDIVTGNGSGSAYATYISNNIYQLFEKSLKENKKDIKLDQLSKSQQDSLTYFSWGHGLKGELGLGHYIHGQPEPKIIKTLNNITEYNDETKKIEATPIKSWSVGRNHVFVTLRNNDVYGWGDNEFGQLGNGKKAKLSSPSTIPALLEPTTTSEEIDRKKKTTDLNDRLQLTNKNEYEQVIVAGSDTTAIYYKKH